MATTMGATVRVWSDRAAFGNVGRRVADQSAAVARRLVRLAPLAGDECLNAKRPTAFDPTRLDRQGFESIERPWIANDDQTARPLGWERDENVGQRHVGRWFSALTIAWPMSVLRSMFR